MKCLTAASERHGWRRASALRLPGKDPSATVALLATTQSTLLAGGASIMSSALSRTLLGTLLRRVLGAGSRAVRRFLSDRSSQTLDAAPSTPHAGPGTKHWCFFQGFVLSGFFRLVPTKACLLESCGGPVPPAIYSMWLVATTMILSAISRPLPGGPAPNQTGDGLASTMRHLGLLDVRTGGVAAQAPIQSHR
jgi:hypothetical protein